VIVFRTSRPGELLSGAPHDEQNRASSAARVPQLGQVGIAPRVCRRPPERSQAHLDYW
jgi:hypothetical protein